MCYLILFVFLLCVPLHCSNIEERWVAFSFEQTKATQKEAYVMDSPQASRLKQGTATVPRITDPNLGFFQCEPLQFDPRRSLCPPPLLSPYMHT